ncbi:15901_t:CDS:2 [Acaulospora morrowiae]|uniref:15901_t:CDS:1 n=1 Tax=Acaulospora morrowiae TaxID=94023 RepID=A0A9N8WF46_9GLOM|nr:15901_t:CDS:2 [Acaulospora morrowiae]
MGFAHPMTDMPLVFHLKKKIEVKSVLQLFRRFSFTKSKPHVPPILLVECLEEILEHLKNDRSTLYSCIFVNRLFCRLAIPLLWRRPFEYPNKYRFRLIRTYISCLDDDQKKILLDNGLKVPDLPKPFFDYPKYMQGFDFFHFTEAIEKWVEGNYCSMPPYLINNMELIEQIIGNMLFSRSNGLRIFKYYRGFGNIINYQYFTDIKLYTSFSHSLSNLRTFEFQAFSYRDNESFAAWSNLFTSIANSTRNIKHLSLFIPAKAHHNQQLCQALSQLILSQPNLSSLVIDELTAQFVYDALTVKAKCLTFLRVTWLKKFRLLHHLLLNCPNLETLEFSQSTSFTDEVIDSTLTTQLPLKNLYCGDGDPSSQIISMILKMSNQNLKTLSLRNVTPEILDAIEQYCPKITHLCLKITATQLPRFITLLSGLALEHLTIENSEEPKYTTEKIKLLAQTIPLSLRYFGIKFSASIRDLQVFFKECGASLNVLALYYIPKMDADTLEYIFKYSKYLRSLREIRFDRKLFKYYQSLPPQDVQRFPVYNYNVGEAKPLSHRFYGTQHFENCNRVKQCLKIGRSEVGKQRSSVVMSKIDGLQSIRWCSEESDDNQYRKGKSGGFTLAPKRVPILQVSE